MTFLKDWLNKGINFSWSWKFGGDHICEPTEKIAPKDCCWHSIPLSKKCKNCEMDTAKAIKTPLLDVALKCVGKQDDQMGMMQ